MKNQIVAMTLNPVGKYDNLISQVEPVEATHTEMVEMKEQGKLIPGQWYRITDFVTTSVQDGTRSAGHAFDILVRADDVSTLNENAYAIQHENDTYFANAKLSAWQLKYQLENVKWSQVAGTFCVEENDGYSLIKVGTVTVDETTYILWKDARGNLMEDYDVEYAVSEDEEVGTNLYKFDVESQEVLSDEWSSPIESTSEVEEDGKGTITWMRDEHGNECTYDFKNIQFKVWKVTDAKGRQGLDGKYMGFLDNLPQDLTIEDDEDFIWAYTFSSDNTGEDDQEDYSLDGTHSVFDNVFPGCNLGLNYNVMFGENNYRNHIGYDCYYNSWGDSCYRNSWGNYCNNNSWGNSCSRNSWGNSCQYNSWGNNCYSNSWGNYCNNNSWGNECFYNSWGNSCQKNSWGNDCSYNSWGNSVTYCTLFEGINYTKITTENVKNAQVLNGVAGTSDSMLTLGFAANKSYTQVACKNTSGTLKILVPGDLA